MMIKSILIIVSILVYVPSILMINMQVGGSDDLIIRIDLMIRIDLIIRIYLMIDIDLIIDQHRFNHQNRFNH